MSLASGTNPSAIGNWTFPGFSWTQVSKVLALLRHLKGGFYRAQQTVELFPQRHLSCPQKLISCLQRS